MITHFLAVEEDITQRLEADRTKQRLLAKLSQAQKLESLGVMADGIAHDFNNILMSIMGNIDLSIMELSMDSPTIKRLRQVQRSAEQAARLTDQLLAFSGRKHRVWEFVRLSDLVDDSWKLLKGMLAENEHLKSSCAPSLPLCEADGSQLQQVLLNLTINAAEAIEDSNGEITVSTGVTHVDDSFINNNMLTSSIAAGPYVYLEVSDTGCGIPADAMDKIFDPFFSTKFAGRGLGLSVAQGIVHSHSGAICVESEPGNGTTVRVLLPCSGIQEEALCKKRYAAPLEWSGEGRLILVDQDPAVLSVAREILEKKGFSVFATTSSKEALEFFKKYSNAVRCIIMDSSMPKIEGAELYEKIRQADQRAKIIISGDSCETDSIAELARSGQLTFLQKPYPAEQLIGALYLTIGDSLDQCFELLNQNNLDANGSADVSI